MRVQGTCTYEHMHLTLCFEGSYGLHEIVAGLACALGKTHVNSTCCGNNLTGSPSSPFIPFAHASLACHAATARQSRASTVLWLMPDAKANAAHKTCHVQV
jgi:hypothetical protein